MGVCYITVLSFIGYIETNNSANTLQKSTIKFDTINHLIVCNILVYTAQTV